MEQNELPDPQTQIRVLAEKVGAISDNAARTSESFSRMGIFVKEQFNKMQSQIEANLRPERLYTVHANKSESIAEISKALALAKAEIGSITKGSAGARGGFASLTDMFEVCDPVMMKFELSTTFGVCHNEYGEYVLVGLLSHSSGQWIESRCLLNEHEIPDKSIPSYHQRVASAEKSLRRYMYRAMLNLADKSD